MGQGTDTYNSETHREREQTNESKGDESATGRDIPGGDGTVGDEQLNAIGKQPEDRRTGKDHSTDHHEQKDADHGVQAIQDREDTSADIARIRD